MSVKGRIHLLECNKNYISIKLKSCVKDLSTANKDIYLCATRIPPEGLAYYSDEIFTYIQSDMLNASRMMILSILLENLMQ